MPFDTSVLNENEILEKYKEIMEFRLDLYKKYSDVIYINENYDVNRKTSLIKNKN